MFENSISDLPKKIQLVVEAIVSVQTGPKFAHIISIPSFYTFEHLNEIKLKKNELQLILSAYELPRGISYVGANRTHTATDK